MDHGTVIVTELPQFSPGHTASSSNDTVTAPAWAQNITKVAESGFQIKHGAADIHLSHSSAIDGLRLTLTPRADIDWVFDQSLSYATACLVDPQHVLWAQDGVSADTTTADSTDFWRTSWSSQKTRNLVLFMLTWSPLLSMPAFHALSLEIHSSLGCPWWAPCHKCQGAPMLRQELKRQSLQHQNEEQWAKDSTLMHTKILHQTHHCTDHWPSHDSRRWSTCSGWPAQPNLPPQGSLWPIIGPSLAHDRRLSESLRRQIRVAS